MVSGAGGCGGRCPCPEPGVCEACARGCRVAHPSPRTPPHQSAAVRDAPAGEARPPCRPVSSYMSPGVEWTVTENDKARRRIQLLDFNHVFRRVIAITLLGLLIGRARPGVRRTSRRRSPPRADRERRSHGRRPAGSVRTGADGRFEWALRAAPPLVFVVILQDGVVCRPIHVTTLDEATGVTLVVEAAMAQSVEVSGAAPGIDVSAGASTSLVNAADIGLRHPITVGEILENIPGVSVISEGQSATPAIRGLARGRTSIMVDGSRASSERRAGANASFLDPAIVERVEVARGPASVAYGSDAMGGVIAVRTRGPDYTRPLQVRFAGTLGGGFPEVSGDLEVSAGYGSGGILAGVRGRDFDSYDSPEGPVPNSGWRDGGARLRWEHATRSAVWSVGWQTDLEPGHRASTQRRRRRQGDDADRRFPAAHRLVRTADRLADSIAFESMGCSDRCASRPTRIGCRHPRGRAASNRRRSIRASSSCARRPTGHSETRDSSSAATSTAATDSNPPTPSSLTTRRAQW